MLKRLARLLGGEPHDPELAAIEARRAAPLEYQFCSVFVVRKKLYLGREEGHAGPRLLLFPPRELPVGISAPQLGGLVHDTLASYVQTGIPISAPQWDVLNREMLDHFGFTRVADFERRKRDVTVRRMVATGEVQLHADNPDQIVKLVSPEAAELGSEIRKLLRLPAPTSTA